MSSHRLLSTLYHSVPKPASRPVPLWQAAAPLDPATRQPMAASETPVITGRGREADARRPLTSAVQAGWICTGLGLLTAWMFPPANFFFSIAIILSIVAMASHQVRAGLSLLLCSLAGIGFSVLLFMAGLAALVFHAVKTLPEIKPLPTPELTASRFSTPASITRGPRPVEGIVGSVPVARPAPLTLDGVTAMLDAGRSNDEIIAAAASRSFHGWVGASEITTLRAFGADDRLIEYLRAQSAPSGLPSSSYHAPPAPASFTTTQTPSPSAAMQTTTAAPALPTPVDHAARDRQIAALQRQIDNLDETIRRVRADPHVYGLVKGSTNTSRQQASDAYLAELDRQRNDLRRQKWALEGR